MLGMLYQVGQYMAVIICEVPIAPIFRVLSVEPKLNFIKFLQNISLYRIIDTLYKMWFSLS